MGSVLFQIAAGSTNGNSVTTPAQNTTGANLIVIAASFYTGGASAPTLSDSKGNTWTALTGQVSSFFNTRLFYCFNPTVGSNHTFSLTIVSGQPFPTISVLAASGAQASPFDVQNGGAAASGTSLATGSITPGSDNEIVVSAICNGGTATKVDNGLQSVVQTNVNSQCVTGGIAYFVQNTAAAINPTWTWTASSANAAAIASFKMAATGASATGNVQFIGTVLSSGDDATGPRWNATDNDFTTSWKASTANGGWIGLDLGASATVNGYELAPIASTTFAAAEETRPFGALVQSAAASNFASPTTYDTIPTQPTAPFNSPGVRNYHSLSGASASQYWRFLGATGTYGGSFEEIRFIGAAGTAATAKPCRPVISPFGGSAVSGSVTVTITSPTTSASIYYTIDGSAPSYLSTLYTAPFVLTVGGNVTVRAIAYDTNLSTAVSEECNQAHFRNYEFAPADTWYDTNGEIVESKDPSISEWPVGSGTYWMASNSGNVGHTTGHDQIGRYGIWLYSATLTNYGFSVWTNHGNVIGTPAEYTGILRPSLLACPNTGKLTLWAHGYVDTDESNFKARTYYCSAADPSVPGNWTDNGDVLPDSQTAIGDFSRVLFNGNGYLLYKGDASTIIVSKLTSDFLNTTGTDRLAIPGSSGESPVGVQWGSKLIIAFSSVENYYHNDLPYSAKVCTTTDPLNAGAYSALTDFYASDPAGTNFNAQPASIFIVPRKVNGFMLLADYWVGGAYGVQEPSRSTWLPIDVSGAAPVASMPATWDFTTFTSVPSPGRSGVGSGVYIGLGP